MDTLPPTLRMHSKGFWLPVGRTNFFDPLKSRTFDGKSDESQFDKDRQLIRDYNGNNLERPDHLEGYRIIDLKITPRPRLQSSVFYRLLCVAGSDMRAIAQGNTVARNSSKRYSQFFPLFSDYEPTLDKAHMPDPKAVILTMDDFSSREWNDVRPFMAGLTLMVHSNGFYIWSVFYHSEDPTNIDPAKMKRREKERENLVDEALDEHMEQMIGKDFFSHYSPHDPSDTMNGQADATSVAEYEREPSLQTYRDKNIGILNFFQLNTLLEGLYNYNFDPRVFFDDGADDTLVRSVKEEYSVSNFIYLIRTKIDFSAINRKTEKSIAADLYTLITAPESLADQAGGELLKRLYIECFESSVRFTLLRQFFRKTSADVLHLMKLRIESCSRELLTIMIEIAHLRQPLLQADVPVSFKKEGSTQDRYIIKRANEGQLRGYVMLLAAKIPLFINVLNYLEDNLNALKDLDLVYESRYREIIRPDEQSWLALLNTIQQSSQGLERAIEQAYFNQMLEDTEKLVAEQENLAEIERIRERSGNTLSPANNLVVSIIANMIALIGVVVAVLIGGKQLAATFPFILSIERLGPIAIIAIVFGFVIVLGVVYNVLQAIVNAIFRFGARVIGRNQRHRDERYYYEMDLVINKQIDEDHAYLLLKGDLTSKPADQPPHLLYSESGRLWPYVVRKRGRRPERSSYRIDRMNRDQALHKVYIDAYLIWPRGGPLRSMLPKQRMRVFIVYEILFHQPSGKEEYKIKSVRMVSNTDQILQPDRIKELQSLIVWEFVNRWISSQRDKFADTDAVFSLVVDPETRKREKEMKLKNVGTQLTIPKN